MLVTTALILKSNTFSCPPFRPPSPGSAHSPPYPSSFDPLVLSHSIFTSNTFPTPPPLTPWPYYAPLPLWRFISPPINPPPPNQQTPSSISDSSHSSKPFVHIAQCIFFHTDFLVQSCFPISTLLPNPNTHSPISIDLSPSRTSLPPHLPFPPSS